MGEVTDPSTAALHDTGGILALLYHKSQDQLTLIRIQLYAPLLSLSVVASKRQTLRLTAREISVFSASRCRIHRGANAACASACVRSADLRV